MDRLGREIRRPGFEGVLHRREVIRGRHHQDRDLASLGQSADRPAGLEAVQTGELDVEKDEIGAIALDLLQPLFPTPGFDHTKSGGRQLEPRAGPETRVVIDHDHPRRALVPCAHGFASTARTSSSSTSA